MHRLSQLKRLFFSLAGALLLAACGNDAPIAPLTVASIRLTPPTLTLTVGQTVRLTATPLSASGEALLDRPVTWSSASTARATVAADGTVTALAAGEAVISATSEGISASATITINVIPATRLTVDIGALVRNEGAVTSATAQVFSATGALLLDRVVTWSSDNADVATVNAAGLITAVSEGSTRIVARHGALEATVDIRVMPWFGAMLLFDRHDATAARSRLFRADPRGPLSENQPIFSSAGTWDVTASPTGERVAFTCATLTGTAICSARLDGTDVRTLTDGDVHDETEAAWSPDGTRIAFRRRAHIDNPSVWGKSDIWVMNADGSNQINLTNDALAQHHPTWSPLMPDGSYRIAFAQGTAIGGYIISRIHSIKADGTERRAETVGGEYMEDEPAWSPDGQRLLFTRTGGTANGDLWTVNIATRVEQEFLNVTLAGPQRSPAWSPDGRHVVFASSHAMSGDGGFRDQLFTVRANGTGLTRRTDGSVAAERPTWLAFP